MEYKTKDSKRIFREKNLVWLEVNPTYNKTFVLVEIIQFIRKEPIDEWLGVATIKLLYDWPTFEKDNGYPRNIEVGIKEMFL